MLLFIEGVDRAGKSTFIKGLEDTFGFTPFALRYPGTCVPIGMSDYFLGANTFLLEMYKVMQGHQPFNLAVHRGFLSEYVYSPLFGREVRRDHIQLWLDQWPDDAALIHLTISHDDYLRRATDDDTISLASDAHWRLVVSRYQHVLAFANRKGKTVISVSGAIPFKEQMRIIVTYLPKGEEVFARAFW